MPMQPICDRPILSVRLRDETQHSSRLLHLSHNFDNFCLAEQHDSLQNQAQVLDDFR
ncbi:MAG: hypothetical protein RIE73_32575 [Coleofasciculus sp. C1-SOL-03]